MNTKSEVTRPSALAEYTNHKDKRSEQEVLRASKETLGVASSLVRILNDLLAAGQEAETLGDLGSVHYAAHCVVRELELASQRAARFTEANAKYKVEQEIIRTLRHVDSNPEFYEK